MIEMLPYYLIPTLVAAAIVETTLWWWRGSSGNTWTYLFVAAGARAVAYSPAIAAGGHGAAMLPFFAAMLYMMLRESAHFLEMLLYNGAIALPFFLLFAGFILARQLWTGRKVAGPGEEK